MNIRLAQIGDSAALIRIYEQYIDTPVTFEYTCPTTEEFAARIDTIGREYPFLVCEDNGRMAGYAYAHRQMERAAYQWNAQLSVYLDKDYTSRGIGKTLYRLLIDLLRLQGIKTVYGGVTLPNEKSERLHESLGFCRLGIYRHTGYKCHRWQDVVWFEKEINVHWLDPAPFIPFSQLESDKIKRILCQVNTCSNP